jgi:hypothetical protein
VVAVQDYRTHEDQQSRYVDYIAYDEGDHGEKDLVKGYVEKIQEMAR